MKPLTVPGELASLEQIAAYVQRAAERAALDERATYRLRLAVDEIATNAIVHGYEAVEEAGLLRITAVFTPTQLTIHLDDTGHAYDPTQCPHPANLHAPANERQPGGLGIYLALAGVDQFRHQQLARYNRNTFIVKRQPALQPAF